jgi:hypothetical protein
MLFPETEAAIEEYEVTQFHPKLFFLCFLNVGVYLAYGFQFLSIVKITTLHLCGNVGTK